MMPLWLERLIHNNAYVALVAYTPEMFSVQLILNVIVPRLARMQPKNMLLFCVKISHLVPSLLEKHHCRAVERVCL